MRRQPEVKPVLKRFGEKLQSWMDRKDIPQKSFPEKAKQIGSPIDWSRLNKALRGVGHSPTLETAQEFTRVLGLTLEEFYADTEYTALEKRFSREFAEFRNLLLHCDDDAVHEVMNQIRYAVMTYKERVKARDRPTGKQQGG